MMATKTRIPNREARQLKRNLEDTFRRLEWVQKQATDESAVYFSNAMAAVTLALDEMDNALIAEQGE